MTCFLHGGSCVCSGALERLTSRSLEADGGMRERWVPRYEYKRYGPVQQLETLYERGPNQLSYLQVPRERGMFVLPCPDVYTRMCRHIRAVTVPPLQGRAVLSRYSKRA
jgi:hypothetical protein